MSNVTCQISISLDGFVAGPDQSPEDPLGKGGERLHEWVIATKAWRSHHGREGGEQNADSDVVERLTEGIGAYIMGRRMFGGGDGEWDTSWRGWWGDEPPFRLPVFVLTHHEREPLEMAGGTTFHFVTGGIETALGLARATPRAIETWRSPAARAPCASTSRRACSMSCTCTSSRSCSAPASGCSRASATPSWSRSRSSARRLSRTCATASCAERAKRPYARRLREPDHLGAQRAALTGGARIFAYAPRSLSASSRSPRTIPNTAWRIVAWPKARRLVASFGSSLRAGW